MNNDCLRIKITEFLQWNDGNGCYTDDFYYNLTGNIFSAKL